MKSMSYRFSYYVAVRHSVPEYRASHEDLLYSDSEHEGENDGRRIYTGREP